MLLSIIPNLTFGSDCDNDNSINSLFLWLIADFARIMTEIGNCVRVRLRGSVCLINGDVRFVHLASIFFSFAPFGDRLGLNNIISSQLWLTSQGVTKSGWGLALQMRTKEDQVASLCLLVYHFLQNLIWDSRDCFLPQSVCYFRTKPILLTCCHLKAKVCSD